MLIMAPWLIHCLIVITSFFGMEFIAWFTHKYVMHGLLWSWHEDHHKPHQLKTGFGKKTIAFF